MNLINLLQKYKTLTNDEHIKWMCDEIIRMRLHEPWLVEKIHRWIGFIQGFLFCNKMRTIHELREETRGIDES